MANTKRGKGITKVWTQWTHPGLPAGTGEEDKWLEMVTIESREVTSMAFNKGGLPDVFESSA